MLNDDSSGILKLYSTPKRRDYDFDEEEDLEKYSAKKTKNRNGSHLNRNPLYQS
jgi:hypothetical protein